MATLYSPKIVTDGLVLYLDATNEKSYGGTGSLWKNLGGSVNGTMYGSVPFSVDVVKCFDFAGATGANAANSSLGFTFSSNMIPTTGNFTLECWIKNPNAAYVQVGMFSNAGGGDGYRFGVGQNGIYWLIGPTYAEGGIAYADSFDNMKWHHVVTTWDRTSTKRIYLYLDGKYQNLANMNATQTAFSATSPGLVRSACCGIYTGKIAVMSAYNRLLTADEVLANYNATKGKFGR
jgi:hypothetical protein